MKHFYPSPQVRIEEIELLEKMITFGGQSDLWTGNLHGQKLAVKLFRPGFAPAADPIPDIPELLIPIKSGVIDGTPYEAFEFLEHGNLRQVTGHEEEIFRQLARGVCALHKAGILHRDLKPENILIRCLEPLQIAICDFGSVRQSVETIFTSRIQGTPLYMAPEAAQGMSSQASDWWALGMILLERLLGAHPWAAVHPSALFYRAVSGDAGDLSKLPGGWHSLIAGLLERDHTKRWGADQVLDWLSHPDSRASGQGAALGGELGAKEREARSLVPADVEILPSLELSQQEAERLIKASVFTWPAVVVSCVWLLVLYEVGPSRGTYSLFVLLTFLTFCLPKSVALRHSFRVSGLLDILNSDHVRILRDGRNIGFGAVSDFRNQTISARAVKWLPLRDWELLHSLKPPTDKPVAEGTN